MTGDFQGNDVAGIISVYKHGELMTRISCESAEDAADALAQFEEIHGVEFVFEDLGTSHGALDVLAAETEDLIAEEERRN